MKIFPIKRLLLAILLFPSVLYAEVDYKCYVGLSNAEPWIMVTFANDASQAKEQLKNQFIRLNNRRLRVNHIFECVPMGHPFSDDRAKALEENMRF